MITIKVDMDKCQHYGQCVYEAPEIFKLNENNKLEYLASADESERDNVKSASDTCPMQAIQVFD